MTPETAAPIQTYLDMLAVALAAGATWWRDQLRKRHEVGKYAPALSDEQLDHFERELCLGMVKLLLRNALERGLSWREWNVQSYEAPHGVLRDAASAAGIGLHCFPPFVRMSMRSTNDEVYVEVKFSPYGDQPKSWQHVWPVKQ
jgi:hypothetical protein